jgi:hypothetical protein
VTTEDRSSSSYRITEGEFSAFILESILCGAGVMAAIMALGRRLLPTWLWFGAGWLSVGIAIFPVLRAHLRNRYGRRLSLTRVLAWWVPVAAIAGLLYALLG